MPRIALLGYGHMGRAVESLLEARGHELAGVVAQGSRTTLHEVLAQADVAIEFTRPEAAEELCREALAQGVAVVSGTTGWDPTPLQDRVRERDWPAFLHATNMSIGVHAVFAANELLARVLGAAGGYLAEVEETHHRHKRDAPSGTAGTLSEAIIAAHPSYQRLGLIAGYGLTAPAAIAGISEPGVLPVRAHRRGEIFGEHAVRFTSEVDAIELRHAAASREGFALGAVVAAEFVAGKRGVFAMRDVLGIPSAP